MIALRLGADTSLDCGSLIAVVGTLATALALALAVAAPTAGDGARERRDAAGHGAPTPATRREAPRSAPDDRTARELALLHQHALRDPFAGPPLADTHAGSPDLRDPFVPVHAEVEPLPSPDLRDPFVDVTRPPRATTAPPAPPRIDACRPTLDGVPLQRARALPPRPPTCDVAPAPRRSPPPPPPAPKPPSAATHAGVATLRA